MAAHWTMRASPVTTVCFRGQRVHVKRDDVFHLAGNKMRKLYWFLQQDEAYYHGAHFVSFGGTQSNAMLAVAQLANAKRVPFTYFSRALDIKAGTSIEEGNLATAKKLGMHHIELETESYRELAATKGLATFVNRFSPPARKHILVPQGAAFVYAEDGVRVLAHELNDFCARYTSVETRRPDFAVVVPCGTGTTAFYLAQHLDPRIKLLAVPCVGSPGYLLDQFHVLAKQKNTHVVAMPEILAPSKKIRFGQCSLPLFHTHHELLEATGIEFDLLYAAYTWQTLFEPSNLRIALDAAGTTPPRELIYIHTGGVSGNGTMLERYLSKANPELT